MYEVHNGRPLAKTWRPARQSQTAYKIDEEELSTSH